MVQTRERRLKVPPDGHEGENGTNTSGFSAFPEVTVMERPVHLMELSMMTYWWSSEFTIPI